jgi:Uncharacterised protein family (UPF0158)
MKEVPIDLDYLAFAYQDDSPDNVYYLDTEFGDIRLVNKNLAELKDLTDELEKTEGRFLYIPKPSKELLIEDLGDFMATVQDENLKNILPIAFESPHVYEAFKSILAKTPEEITRLNAFLQLQTKARITKWLNANFIKLAAQ